MTYTFQITHTDWNQNEMIPFHSTNSDKVFSDPIFGIKVEKVISENLVLTSKILQANFLDDVNLSKINLNADFHIYLVRRDNFIFARNLHENGDFELEEYILEPSAKHIQIEYVVRYGPNSFGSKTILHSKLL